MITIYLNNGGFIPLEYQNAREFIEKEMNDPNKILWPSNKAIPKQSIAYIEYEEEKEPTQ